MRDELRTMLEAEESQERWSDWLQQELRDADIEYADDYRPSDPYDVSAWQQDGVAGAPAEDTPRVACSTR